MVLFTNMNLDNPVVGMLEGRKLDFMTSEIPSNLIVILYISAHTCHCVCVYDCAYVSAILCICKCMNHVFLFFDALTS